jgi:hypothetical protein
MADAGRVAFELDRFEVTEDGRLEVAGRWFGVRGLRFVRPSLMLETDGGERNLLALLDHKPWEPTEGDTWIAAFPWDGGEVDPGQAELAVAPSVVVPLVGQSAAARNGGGRPALREKLDTEERHARRLESEVAWMREERADLVARTDRVREERDRAIADRDAARHERDQLAAEHDAAVSELDELRAGRSAAGAEADSAVRQREAALRRAERAEAEYDEAKRERDAALMEARRALADRDAALRDREIALRDRDQAARERDTAFRGRSAALSERDAARNRHENLATATVSELVPRARSPLEQLSPPASARDAWGSSHASWLARLGVVTILLGIVLVLVVLLRLL